MEGMRRFALQVDRWIRCAVTKKVKVLYLNLAYSKGPMYGFPYKVPGHIFSNDSITELLMCVCRLNPFRPIRWNNLKSLFLYDILLSDELIQNILSGTPLLEVIRLPECKGMRKVIITNPKLKGLALVCSSGPWIELSAPHVQTLEISGDMEQDRLKNVSSLLGGQVIPEGQTIDDSFQNLLRRAFESVRHAIVLGLSTRCLQVFLIKVLCVLLLAMFSTQRNMVLVRGFLTLIFFPKGNKDGEEYDGRRNLEDLLIFINEKSGTIRDGNGQLTFKAGIVISLDALVKDFVSASNDEKKAVTVYYYTISIRIVRAKDGVPAKTSTPVLGFLAGFAKFKSDLVRDEEGEMAIQIYAGKYEYKE
ncbi:hypothetical protein IFM89_032172 [Coptis chinensis]|uniref:At1g61320/AtMIF1 LRR domain-containing protein n=1 Tax=Coptis chinensis TaxID=261450 RepID=A0A835J398_9MAGN|nr:hypothetical protein IFM89_032172 [Coptis chinensis]